jgi:glycosyltransferase involved in cell wall biosynthesis
MKLLFLIRSLYTGGAERQIVVLSRELQRRGHEITLATFYSGGSFEEEARAAGVRLVCLNKRGRWDNIVFYKKLIELIDAERPDILHTYLDVANVFGSLLRWRIPGVKLVWGIRDSEKDFNQYDWLSMLSFRTGAQLSRTADLIIANSHAGLAARQRGGYQLRRAMIIHNGIDTDRFKPDGTARSAVRSEWGVRDHEPLVGLVARLSPVKDHPAFLQSAAQVIMTIPFARFVCVGKGPDGYAAKLRDTAAQLGLGRRIHWAGERTDMPRIYNALDVAVSSSLGEGFSNAIAEAMACGCPCVVTNVGDSSLIVGDRGRVVPLGEPLALGAGITELLASPPSAESVRRRITERYDVRALVDRTEAAFRALID